MYILDKTYEELPSFLNVLLDTKTYVFRGRKQGRKKRKPLLLQGISASVKEQKHCATGGISVGAFV